VRVYNRALTPTEIRQLYKAGSSFHPNTTNKSTIRDGLVGHWTFDGADMGTTSARDASGNANTGWLINGAKKAIGRIGQALNFDGVNDFVDGGNVGNVQTISYWIKSNNQANGGIELNSNQYVDDNAIPEGMVDPTLYIDGVVKTLYGSELVTNGDMEAASSWSAYGSPTSQARSSEQAYRGTYSWKIVSPSSWRGAMQSVSVAGSTQYKITGWSYVSSGVGPYIALENCNSGACGVMDTGSNTTAVWTFGRGYGTTSASPPSPIVDVISRGGATTFYADDVSLKQVLIRYPITDTNWRHVVITTGTAVNASAVKIGKGGTSYMNGLIDEVRIYNRALSPAEIKRLYNMGR